LHGIGVGLFFHRDILHQAFMFVVGRVVDVCGRMAVSEIATRPQALNATKRSVQVDNTPLFVAASCKKLEDIC